ncbi:tetratricopeptide repeat protein [filamentous cyanobacterium LEGE 07170]|nr:tetratricopeptide repeat protein [filamentous cyanobacterium LEGE 07170]
MLVPCWSLILPGLWPTPPALAQIRLTESPSAQARRLSQEAYQLWQSGQFQSALERLEQALPIYQDLGDRPSTADVLLGLAKVTLALGQPVQALDYYEQALTLQRELGDTQSERVTLNDMGEVYRRLGQYNQALNTYRASLAVQISSDDRVLEAITLNNIGSVYNDQGQYEQALAYYEQALTAFTDPASRQADPQQSRRGEGVTLNNMGTIHDFLGQYGRALELYQQSLAIRIEIGDRQGESVTLSNIGQIQHNLSNYEAALESYQQALAITTELGNRAGEATVLNNIGAVYSELGQYADALDNYLRVLAFRTALGDRPGEGTVLNNIGAIHHNLGQYEQALNYYQRSLVIQQEIGNRRGESSALNNLGKMYIALGSYAEALDYLQQALALWVEMGDRAGEGGTLNDMGLVYANLGQYERALNTYQQALTIRIEVGDRTGEADTLNNIGVVYDDLGQYERALNIYERSLAINTEIGDRAGEGTNLSNIGAVYGGLEQYDQALDYFQRALTIRQTIGDRTGEGNTLNNLGAIYDILKQYDQALAAYQQALAIRTEVGDRPGEGTTLNNIGYIYANQGNYSQAMTTYQQSLAIRREVGDREGEAVTLNNLGIVLDALGETELAIAFFKQAVNQWEAIRGDIRGLDIEHQQAFTERVSSSYRRLADLLLQANRVLEAQEVLDLLKLQELQDFQLQNVRGTAETRQGLDLWAAEESILALLAQSLESPDTDLNDFIALPEIRNHIEELQRNAQGQNLNPAQLVRLQDNLQQLGNTALLYPLILDDRLELVLVTPTGLVRETVAVDRTTLEGAIANFRRTITNRRSNPVMQAQELYQWLIAPISSHLEQEGVETLLYAADGSLRYIPLAALHDGEQWLTQRYTLNHITAASLTDFSRSEASNLDILAGAFPETDVQVTIDGDAVVFGGLPYAQAEVDYLVDTLPNTTAFFDNAFSRAAIEPQLNNYSIVHFATHAEFRSGHPNDSYILLGDGDRITLADLDQWQLTNVNLVVLSACKTAVGATDLGNGEEILGFGYQIQQTGADAAIASLWYVDDGSTQALMTAFYEALRTGDPEAVALQEAQRALIADSALAHPYYWAPFILIGNGL